MRIEPGSMVHERLRLVRELGRGGMGSVWIAHHDALDIDVAVKFISEGGGDLAVARFRREAQLAAKLAGPNVVRVLDHGLTSDGVPFIAMELLRGETLAERLATVRRIPPAELVRIVTEVADGLTEAHALGIVHRDIKPQNLFLSRSHTAKEVVKILDFGIARSESKQDAITASGPIVGTLLYMSPEQLLESGSADKSADLWALAVVAFEALTGRHPFAADTVARTMIAVTRAAFERASRGTELPDAVDAFFERAFAPDRAARFPTATALAEALAEAVAGSSGRAGVDSGSEAPIPSLESTAEYVVERKLQLSAATTEPVSSEVEAEARPDLSIEAAPTSSGRAQSEASSADAPGHAATAERDGRRPRRALALALALPVAGAVVALGLMYASRDRTQSSSAPTGSPSSASGSRVAGPETSKPASTGVGASAPLTAESAACVPPRTPVAWPPGECPPGMKRIAGGAFVTGLPASSDALRAESERRHATTLHDFCVDVALVSAGDFQSAMPGDSYEARTPQAGASQYCTAGTAASGAYPINCVAAGAASCYCTRIGKRLPTEDEWERAAHDQDTRYPWGAIEPRESSAGGPCWRQSAGPCVLEGVPRDSQRWSARGLLDMAGNLWEWTATPDCSPSGVCGDRTVVRGGSWRDTDTAGGSTKIGPAQLSAALHHSHPSDERSNNVGFRCALDLPASP